MSDHLLGLFDLGQASVEDGALVCEVDAIELLRNLLGDQFLCPAVWAINDHQSGNTSALTSQLFMGFQGMLQCACGWVWTRGIVLRGKHAGWRLHLPPDAGKDSCRLALHRLIMPVM